MAIFTIETPDGRRLKIEAGDEATAIRGAQEWSASNPVQSEATSSVDWNQRFEDLAREQFTSDPALAPQVEGNPYASSLPGPLGHLQNSMSAQQQGMIEGATGNFSNEIASGLLAVPDAMGSAAQGNGFDVGRSFNNIYAQGQEQAAGQRALNPSLAKQGEFVGGAVLGAGAGSFVPRAKTALGMAGLGALEGGAYGAAYGFGGAEGNDRYGAALQGGGQGSVTGGLLGFGAGVLQQPVSQEARLLTRGLQREGIDPNSVEVRIAALGPDAVYADIGANQQMQAAALATTPGPASKTVSDALLARRAGANERIKSGVNEALGTSPRISEVEASLDDARKAVNTEYEPVFTTKALSDDPFMDATPIVASIDSVIPNVVGKTRTKVQGIKSMLIDPRTGKPTQDPQLVMAVRQELDGMIGAETNTRTAGVLSDLRKAIDQDLANSVPGLKAVDAKFEEVAKQGEALERGRTLLNDGKTAQDPADLVQDMLTMSTGQRTTLSQGARADINRIIGTGANDRVKLRDIVRGEGSWNAEKLRTVFGEEKTRQLLDIVDREATLAATENLATAGSRTQVLNAAQQDINPAVNGRGIVQEAMNFQYGNAAAKVADRLLGGALSNRREGMLNNVAEALIGKNLNPQMKAQMNQIIQGMSPRERQIISALMASQGAGQ